MSRRKQAKPQHIHAEDPGSVKNGSLQDDQTDKDWNQMKRVRAEDTYVCDKCCAEFFDLSEFLQHQKDCNKSQQVLIVKDDSAGILSELSQGSLDSCPSDQSDSLSSSDAQSKGSAWTMEEAEMNSEEPQKGLQMEMSAAADMPHFPDSRAQNTNVTLGAMPGTKVAVAQQFSGSKPLSTQVGLNGIPVILEQLLCLQQQQLLQIQLTEQIRIQVAMMVSHGLSSVGVGTAVDPLKALGAHLSQQLSAAAALIGKKAGAQSLSLESLKHGKLPRSKSIPFQSDLTDLAPQVSPFLPLVPRTMAFQSPFAAVPAGPEPSRKGKGKILSAASETKVDSGEPNSKRKCVFCGKRFGNESGLQIHLRSHTGERPYKCNICGNRFTTRGNLKVHFQRHKDKYPYVRMNPHPVPEHLDNVPATNGNVPYPMSMPSEESGFMGRKPIPGPLSSGDRLAPWPTRGLLENVAYSQRPPSFGIERTFAPSGVHVRADPILSPLKGLGGLHSLSANGEQSSGTSKLQQMVDCLEKTGSSNECTICHRVLSCQSSLKMHYRTHTGERPYKCKVCGRAFSTNGNLKAHQAVHRASAPLRTQHSCPICQKKFTNAVVLQQHIRMHMGGQISNNPVPEGAPFTDPLVMGPSPPEEKPAGLNGFSNENMDDFPDSQKRLDEHQEPLSLRTTLKEEEEEEEEEEESSDPSGPVTLDNQMESFASALNLQRKTSVSETDGMPDEPPSHEDPSPRVCESGSFQGMSPVASHFKTKSPNSAVLEDRSRGMFRPDWIGGLWDPDTSGALDLTSASFFPKAINEEVGVSFSNGEHRSSHVLAMTGPHSLGRPEMPIPQGNPFSPNGLFCPPILGAGVPPPGSTAPRRPAKQHVCQTCGKNFSSSSSLQIHARTHTGEKPFACTFCNRAFTTKGNLKVHLGTHMGSASARQGRRLSVDNPKALMESNPAPEMAPPLGTQGPPLIGVDFSMPSQCPAVYTNGLSMKTNEISVIQGGGVPLLRGPAGSPPGGALGRLMKMEGSQSSLPTPMDTDGSDGVPQFPLFMEERAPEASELN